VRQKARNVPSSTSHGIAQGRRALVLIKDAARLVGMQQEGLVGNLPA
jgi:hypothetical protein